MKAEKTVHSITFDSLMGSLYDAWLKNFHALNNLPFRGRGGILLCIFALTACLPLRLHAEKAASACIDIINIYITEDAKIYIADGTKLNISAEQLLAKHVKTGKKAAGIKEETPESDENKVTEQESTTVVVPVFPFESSSSSFLRNVRESAVISPQYRINHHQPAAKTCSENTYRQINNPDLSLYHPKQRQKLSTAATQCGMMTSFESTSPPFA